MSRFLVTEEVAELLRTTPATVRYWRQTGYGPRGRKVGRRVLYDAAEVEAFWSGLEQGDVPGARR